MNEEQQYIIEKVCELYKKFGIKSVTMDDVARELGISKKTLYTHFVDKASLVKVVIEYDKEKLAREYSAIFQKGLNAIEEMFEVNQFVMNIIRQYSPTIEYDLKKYYPAIQQNMQEKKLDNMYNTMLGNLKKGKKEGLYRKKLDEELIAKIYVTRIESMAQNHCFNYQELDIKKMLVEMLEYHIRGIASEEGNKVLEDNLKKMK
ncbi:MAG: TetR/AcrR family transcriptional regulator [Bacteroidota bacterium]